MKTLQLIETALRESAAAKPYLAEFAIGAIQGSIENVFRGEDKFKHLTRGNATMAEFVGRGRDKVYILLFTTMGVSEETAGELVKELMTIH